MLAHHLKLNLDKPELLFLPGKACLLQDLSITVDNSTVSHSQSAKNLGMTLDNTLSFSTNIKTALMFVENDRVLTHSCRLMIYNIPACAIKPLQLT